METTSHLRRLLKEIEAIMPSENLSQELDTQARHAFTAVQRLFTKLDDHCDEETKAELTKRFLAACKSNDYRKFSRGVKRIDNPRSSDEGSKDDTSE